VIGCLLFAVVVIAIVAVVVVTRRRRQEYDEDLYDEGSSMDLPSIESVISDDTLGGAADPDRTMDEGEDYSTGQTTIPAGSVPPARLVVIAGLNYLKGDAFTINKARVTFGRSAGDIVNDIDIQDKQVSRQHAEIVYDGRDFNLRDLRSTYGTQVNGKPVYSDPVALRDGAEIVLGRESKSQTRFRFELSTPSAGVDADQTVDEGVEDDPFKTSDELTS